MLTRPRTEPSTFWTSLAEMLVTPNLAQSTLKAGLAPRKAVTMILRLSRDLVLKASVQKGCIEMKGEDKEELNQVVFKGSSETQFCGHEVEVKLSDVLYQPDYGGHDYEDMMTDNATVVCTGNQMSRWKGCVGIIFFIIIKFWMRDLAYLAPSFWVYSWVQCLTTKWL